MIAATFRGNRSRNDGLADYCTGTRQALVGLDWCWLDPDWRALVKIPFSFSLDAFWIDMEGLGYGIDHDNR